MAVLPAFQQEGRRSLSKKPSLVAGKMEESLPLTSSPMLREWTRPTVRREDAYAHHFVLVIV